MDQICKLLDEMFLHAMENVERQGKPLSPGDTRSDLNKITADTLILAGEFDFIDYQTIAGIYKEEILNSEMRIFPNAGHFMNLENPDLFNKIVIEFIHRVEQKSLKLQHG